MPLAEEAIVPSLWSNYTIYMDFSIVHLVFFHLAADSPVPVRCEITCLSVQCLLVIEVIVAKS